MLKFSRFLIIALMGSFPAVLAVLFTPALPDLAHFFQISDPAAKTSITTYLIGYALGILSCGPMANRWGRKKTVLAGFFIATIATWLCLWAGKMKLFELFCLLRFFQALGAGSGLKIAFTMIADTYTKDRATRAVSYFMFILSLILALGFGVGGILTNYYGWEGCFVVMALFGVLVMGLICFLPETAKELYPDALAIHRIVHGYTKQFKDPFLVWHALLAGLCGSCYFLYTTEGPYIAINEMNLSPAIYGYLTLIPMLGMASGCYLAAHYAKKQTPRITMVSGLILALIGILTMSVCLANHVLSIASFFLPMGVALLGVYVASSTATAVALDEAIDKSNASAVCLFINIGVSSIVIWLVSLIPQSSLILPLVSGGAIVAMLAIWLKLKAHHARLVS